MPNFQSLRFDLKELKFDLLNAVLTSQAALDLTGGSPAHGNGLKLVNALLQHNQDPDFHVSVAEALLPEDYGGNLLREIPNMVSSGVEKDLHLGSQTCPAPFLWATFR